MFEIDVLENVLSIAGFVVAAIVGFVAVQRLNGSNKQARARVLVDLIRSWESEYLNAARNIYYPEYSKLLEDWKTDTGKDKLVTLGDLQNFRCSARNKSIDKIKKMRSTAKGRKDKYAVLLRAGDFFESVAVLVEREYVSESDVMDLFGHHIRVFDCFAGGYIRNRYTLTDEYPPKIRGGNLYSAYCRLSDNAFGKSYGGY